MLYLAKVPSTVPKGAVRDKMKEEGRVKDIPFFRWVGRLDFETLIIIKLIILFQ